MAKRQRTRDSTAVEPHAVHHAEQRRHENRDVRDMHRDEVLRQAGNQRQHADERQLVTAEQTRQLFGQNIGQTGRGNAGGKGAEQNVRQRGRGVAGKAAGQQLHDGLRAVGRVQQRNAACHTADDARDEHGQQHIQTGQTQDAEHQHGNRDRVCEQAEKNGHESFSYQTKTACSGTCTR